MKIKVLFIIMSLLSLLLLLSCAPSILYDYKPSSVVQTPVIYDLEIDEQKVTGTASGKYPIETLKMLAIIDALKLSGADKLLDPIFSFSKTPKKREITVVGYPANYVNYRMMTVDDIILTNGVEHYYTEMPGISYSEAYNYFTNGPITFENILNRINKKYK